MIKLDIKIYDKIKDDYFNEIIKEIKNNYVSSNNCYFKNVCISDLFEDNKGFNENKIKKIIFMDFVDINNNDSLLTNYLKSAVFILKKELTYIPLFGWAQYFYGMIPINRSAGSKAMKDMLTAARNRINLGRPIIIFPEGTRKAPREEPNYKPGVALLYNHLNVPVIPFATNTAYFWKKSSFLRFPGKVIFEFMEPMPTGMDKNEFMIELQNRIETKCKELACLSAGAVVILPAL